MARKRLRKSDIRALAEELPVAPGKGDVVEQDDSLLLVNGRLWYFQHAGSWVPTVYLLLQHPAVLPAVTVDMGAVRHVANGADIMRPGILAFPDVKEGAIVSIIDERNKKPFAVARMLQSAADARLASSGKSLENVHHVGDGYWKIATTGQ